MMKYRLSNLLFIFHEPGFSIEEENQEFKLIHSVDYTRIEVATIKQITPVPKLQNVELYKCPKCGAVTVTNITKPICKQCGSKMKKKLSADIMYLEIR